MTGLLCAAPLACKSEASIPKTKPPAVAPAKAPPKIDWKSAFKHSERYAAPDKTLMVEVDVAPGFHAYTLGETIGKPLMVTIDPESGYGLAGEITYPKGKVKNLPVGRSVIVEGKAVIKVPVGKLDGKDNKIKGKLRYQVCTDDSCDRPRTVPFTVDAT